MRNIKLVIQYDGSRYRGWQKLGDSDKTIQGKIESVLSLLTNEKIELIGSGRTDAGVHAFKQVANFHTECDASEEEILTYLYKYLPKDIVVIDAKEVDERFHSRYHAKGKKYLYRIWNSKMHNPFMIKHCTHIAEPLDIRLMRNATPNFVGKRDFTSFTSRKSKNKSKERELYSIEISKDNELMDILFHGNGFLYNMARIIAGTLIEVGTGRISAESIPRIFEKKDRSLSGPTAPASGLILYDVEY
ncbi:MAG: tRNA pseudouridine(38-40) synthase TruA [Clostridiaceae bacterium]|nr:tRNA pseudouridine(38-40) synthase TruA [Clostridiaceae bacterium]